MSEFSSTSSGGQTTSDDDEYDFGDGFLREESSPDASFADEDMKPISTQLWNAMTPGEQALHMALVANPLIQRPRIRTRRHPVDYGWADPRHEDDMDQLPEETSEEEAASSSGQEYVPPESEEEESMDDEESE